MFSITKKIVAILAALCLIFLTVTAYTSISVKQEITTAEYARATQALKEQIQQHLSKKVDIGITNAVSFSSNEALQTALKNNDRALAVRTLNQVSEMYEAHTNFKGIKIHLHDRNGFSFVRNWNPDKFGEKLSSFRPLIASVMQKKKAVVGLELGEVGLMIRAISPIIDQNNNYLGSIEFLQGVGSISRDFEKQGKIYILITSQDVANQSPIIAKSKQFGQYYSVNDKWFSDNVVSEIAQLDLDKLIKNRQLVTNDFLFIPVNATLHDGTIVGYHVIGIPRNEVDISINQSHEMAEILIFLFVTSFILTILILLYFLKRVIITPIKYISSTISVIAKGNLTEEINCCSRDELGSLCGDVEKMRTSLHDVINTIQRNSTQMAHSAQQVSAVSTEISSSSKLEQERSAQVLDAINSLLSTSTQVSEHIDNTALSSRETLEIAQDGIIVVNSSIEELNLAVRSVNQTAEQMKELESSTSQINEITDTIGNIAEQTNLLALNAAIEAARAGDQGRGFAVVADEVRKLASRTSSSSNEISELIGQLMEKVENSVISMQSVVAAVHRSQEKSEQTVASFTSMSEGINETTQRADIIANFSHEQTKNLNYLDNKLKYLFDVLQASSNKARTTALVASDLFQISERLDSQLKGFETEQSHLILASENEQRRSPRAENKIRVTIEQDTTSCDGLTHDISIEGLKIRANSMLKKDKDLTVHLHVPQAITGKIGTNITLKAKIVHISPLDDFYTYGVHFINPSASELDKLKLIFQYFKQPYQFN